MGSAQYVLAIVIFPADLCVWGRGDRESGLVRESEALEQSQNPGL